MNRLIVRKKVLMALLLVFMAPGVLAIMFYMHPSWLGGLPTNKGQLIRPAMKLDVLENQKVGDTWELLVWCPAGCDKTCLNILDEMARVRLALGRRLYQVNVWMLQEAASTMCSNEIAGELAEAAIKIHVLSTTEQQSVPILQAIPKVFLADPHHYLVLEYGAKGASQGIFQDLKRLLNTREQA